MSLFSYSSSKGEAVWKQESGFSFEGLPLDFQVTAQGRSAPSFLVLLVEALTEFASFHFLDDSLKSLKSHASFSSAVRASLDNGLAGSREIS